MVGRLIGWLLVSATLLMGSGDAVMAFGFGDHASLAAGDVWALFSGRAAVQASIIPTLLLAVPAWLVTGSLGLLMLRLFRHRRRYYFRNT